MNESTPDGALGLRLVQCDGTCHLAPLVRLNGRYIGPLTVTDAIQLARRLKEEARRA
jgi:NADH:ubiquinone oxidoreductase subunit E